MILSHQPPTNWASASPRTLPPAPFWRLSPRSSRPDIRATRPTIAQRCTLSFFFASVAISGDMRKAVVLPLPLELLWIAVENLHALLQHPPSVTDCPSPVSCATSYSIISPRSIRQRIQFSISQHSLICCCCSPCPSSFLPQSLHAPSTRLPPSLTKFFFRLNVSDVRNLLTVALFFRMVAPFRHFTAFVRRFRPSCVSLSLSYLCTSFFGACQARNPPPLINLRCVGDESRALSFNCPFSGQF